MMRGIVLSAVLSVTIACVAQAQSSAVGGSNLGKAAPGRQVLDDEHIVMPRFPTGWVELSKQPGSIEVVEYVPQGQTAATWREKVSLEIHHGTNTLPIDAFQRRALGQMRENCAGVVEGRLQSGLNNGFPSAFWTLGCKREKRGSFGETRYTKAVQGSATLYMLSWTWRTAPFADTPQIRQSDLDEAMAFLTSSVVCANAARHPCPAPAPGK
jgi:hypothetical protein